MKIQYQDYKGQLIERHEWFGGIRPNSSSLQASRRKDVRDGVAVIVDFDKIVSEKNNVKRK